MVITSSCEEKPPTVKQTTLALIIAQGLFLSNCVEINTHYFKITNYDFRINLACCKGTTLWRKGEEEQNPSKAEYFTEF